MDIHKDGRWQYRDMPSIQSDGLFYPIACYWLNEDMWFRSFVRPLQHAVDIREPIVNDEGMILAIKIGNNKFQVAEHLGYTHIDGIVFENSDEATKHGLWYRVCDPLHNPEKIYLNTFNYD